jgi:lysophospholipase L1-like esterase
VQTVRSVVALAVVLASLVPALLSRAEEKPSAARILALGDSYTIGEGVEGDQRWPEQLARALRTSGIDVAEPRVIATTGWRSDELIKALAGAELAPPYDLVTLQIGVNDQYQDHREATYPQRFVALLRRALELAGNDPARVIVVSIPDYSVTPFVEPGDRRRVSTALERYNRVNRGAATSAGVGYVDITEISRLALGDASLLAADGLHPSGAMYTRWVQEILPLAERALRGHTR